MFGVYFTLNNQFSLNNERSPFYYCMRNANTNYQIGLMMERFIEQEIITS